MVDLNLSSVAELAQAFRSADLTPTAMAEAVVARIATTSELNAFHHLDPEQVRRDAAAATERWRAGAPLSDLDGVPITLKENIRRCGISMPSGTAVADPPVPEVNAPITDRCREQGLVVVGSTTMPDWGMLSSGTSSRHGITPSAWGRALNAGGSSAGAGTAAAAGYGPLHIGSDIGGSIRLPAAWQGLAGLKPSAGLVPLDLPYLGRAAGPMTRTVADLAAAMAAIARPDVRDYSAQPHRPMDWARGWDPRGARIAVQLDGGSGADVEAPVRDAVRAAADLFAAAGAEVVEIPGFTRPEVLAGIDAFWRARSLGDLEQLSEADRAAILPYVARWCTGARGVDAARTVQNYQRFADLARATRLGSADFDLVLSPVAPMATYAADQPMPVPDPDVPMAHISFTLPYNMSGQPAGTVNCATLGGGRFAGLQIAGAIGRDDLVVAAMRWYEAARPAEQNPDWSAIAA